MSDCEKQINSCLLSTQRTLQTSTTFITSASNNCTMHNASRQWYCLYHGITCCVECIQAQHVDCQTRPIARVVEDMKLSATVTHLEIHLQKLHGEIGTILEAINRNISDVHFKKDTCVKEILKMRKTINDHLDKIEKRLLDELFLENKRIEAELGKLKNEMITKQQSVNQMQENCLKIKQSTNDFQTFTLIKEMTANVIEEFKSIARLQNFVSLNHRNFSLEFSAGLKYIINEVSSFGRISAAKADSVRKKDSSISNEVYVEISDSKHFSTNLSLKLQFQLPKGQHPTEISGCVIVPGGQLLFVDETNKRLIMCNNDGMYNRDVTHFWDKPFGVCYIVKKTVAVTTNTASSGEIVFVDITKNKKFKTIQLYNRCYGIDAKNGIIIVRTINRFGFNIEVVVLDIKGSVLSRIKIPEYYIEEIALNDEKIYCTDYYENKVICYSFAGETLWTFKNEQLLCGPRGITIYKNGFICVAGRKTNNIVVLSPDGVDCQSYLNERDRLPHSHSLHVNIARNELVLCSKSGAVQLYSIM